MLYVILVQDFCPDVLVDSVLISFYAVLFMLERVCTFNLRRSFEYKVTHVQDDS